MLCREYPGLFDIQSIQERLRSSFPELQLHSACCGPERVLQLRSEGHLFRSWTLVLRDGGDRLRVSLESSQNRLHEAGWLTLSVTAEAALEVLRKRELKSPWQVPTVAALTVCMMAPKLWAANCLERRIWEVLEAVLAAQQSTTLCYFCGQARRGENCPCCGGPREPARTGALSLSLR